jgi:hypothetical protein
LRFGCKSNEDCAVLWHSAVDDVAPIFINRRPDNPELTKSIAGSVGFLAACGVFGEELKRQAIVRGGKPPTLEN